jgi:mannose-6-phosphate isomerase-like protein (cupin superfamily)
MSQDWKLEHIDDVPPMKDTFQKGWKSVRWHMNIESFGVNASTRNKGEVLTPVHDELDGNQDELFVVLEGTAEFELDGEKIQAEAGTLLSVKPRVKRGAKALEDKTTILIIGAPIGKVYTPPSWA